MASSRSSTGATRCCSEADGAISGEVYWVPEPCWPDLDDWEEVPEVYQRSRVTLRDGRSVWLYEAAPKIN